MGFAGGGVSASTLTKAQVQAGEVDSSPAGQVQAIFKTATIPITVLSTGEKDTGFDLPANAIVLDCFLHIETAESTASNKTIDIGLKAAESGGDTDGFADGLATSATGTYRPGATVTAGGNESYLSAFTRGVLLTQGAPLAGADSAGDVGTYYEKPHISGPTGAKSVVYQLGSAHTELEAFIILTYLELAQ